MYYTIDRIEGDFAVLEDENGNLKDIKLTSLPENVKESDSLRFENHIYIIDECRTEQRKKELTERFNKLFLN